MKVLSLFDGMACGYLAMQSAGIEVERYVAYEIDKYAIQTATLTSRISKSREMCSRLTSQLKKVSI